MSHDPPVRTANGVKPAMKILVEKGRSMLPVKNSMSSLISIEQQTKKNNT